MQKRWAASRRKKATGQKLMVAQRFSAVSSCHFVGHEFINLTESLRATMCLACYRCWQVSLIDSLMGAVPSVGRVYIGQHAFDQWRSTF